MKTSHAMYVCITIASLIIIATFNMLTFQLTVKSLHVPTYIAELKKLAVRIQCNS